ncbi:MULTISPECIES: RsfA family transcriptional regulator [Bacillus]|uniref:RsfA family transcriptional regulator n=1 Tax=Bacillus TaxID=1386 RepID=UPI000BB84B98|nr:MULTISPECIES: RsfA family transcriptional regulator [Bacillus]
MTKVRQDAWSHEEDLLLAETVLRYIRDGGTQLGAFDEVGDKLNRTSAACGFRWNAEVRKKYEHAVSIAKKQRKEKKRAFDKMKKQEEKQQALATTVVAPSAMELLPVSFSRAYQGITQNMDRETITVEASEELTPVPQRTNQNITLDDCISFLTTFERNNQNEYAMKMENERLQRENAELKRKHDELLAKVIKLEKQQETVQEDYQMLVQIMDRARKLTGFENEVM